MALKPLAVMLAFESDRPVDRPVAKSELEVVVMLAELTVAFVSVALERHVKDDDDDVLHDEACAVSVTTTTVVLGGYAVFPSTLVGIGSVVILVKYDFLVDEVLGIEVIGDVVVSCLGRTAALMDPTAKAIALRRRNCILYQVVLCV